MRALVGGPMVLLALLATAKARAECPPELEAWAAACAMRVEGCTDGVVVLGAEPEHGDPLRIELAHGRAGALRRVGDTSISPVGEFADWSREPAATRDAFEHAAACVAAQPVPWSALEPPALARPARWPWLLAAAFALVFTWAFVARRALVAALRVRTCLAMVALTAVTFAGRVLVAGPSFFHQNGQGPLWIDYAVRGRPTPYGPGYVELYAGLAALFPHAPDLAIFAVNGVAAALQPALAYFLARRATAPTWIALGLACAVALTPSLARVAATESYYGVSCTLLLVAAACVAGAGHRASRASGEHWLGVVAAGLVVAQVVRVHPVTWLPAATLPVVALASPGSPGQRAKRSLLVAGAIAAVVGASSGRALRGVLGGAIGERWLTTSVRPAELVIAALLALAALATGAFASRPGGAAGPRRAAPFVLSALAVGALLRSTSGPVEAEAAMFRGAYASLFLPALVTLVGAALASLAPRPALARATGGLVTALALGLALVRRDALTLPTDLREQDWATAWRARLPPGASVYYVSHAGSRIFLLPLYDGGGTARGITGAGETVGRDAYYYRSSLCASPEGSPLCARFEATHVLRPIETRVLPAVPSQDDLPLPSGTLEATLYLVEPSTPASPPGP